MENSFGKSIIPSNDAERIDSLRSLEILDKEPGGYLNNLVQIIARAFNMPIALISLVDEERVFFAANKGMPDTQNVSRGLSLCSLAILDDHPTIFRDTLKEPCLLANPLVAGKFGLRFYAGAPLKTASGFNIGTVCVIDKEPREFSSIDEELLKDFSHVVMTALIKRREEIENSGKHSN